MSLLHMRSLLRTSNVMNSGLKAVAVRYGSHGHEVKPFIPVNAPPNDHLPFKVPTLDDLAVPEGDYYEDFQKRNRKYWRHLIQGVTFLAGTIYCLLKYELVFFNALPPELPPKEKRIKTFWVPPEDDEDDD